MLGGFQPQIEPIVLAETKESILYQQEFASSVTSNSITSNKESEKLTESTINSEISSIKETTINELEEWNTKASTTTPATKSEKVTEESRITGSTTIPEADVKVQTIIPPAKVEENYQFSVTKNQTTQEFIQTIGKDAQFIAWNEELYASVMIAQAILETGSGNSQLAQPPYHNLFGIKGSYQGKQVSFKTQEDKGNGDLYAIQAFFRQYPSYKESLEDYSALLKKGISGNAGFYQGTWKSNAENYQEAAKALTGKYATDTSYDKKLIALIEAYSLTIYDQEPMVTDEAEQEQSIDNLTKVENHSEEKQVVEESSTSSEQELLVNQTKQAVIVIPPTAQRPAKQLPGKRIVQ